ncbi:MAG: Gfo/Idh/MocA family protein [Candidatus Aminicenantales bacterium]
MKTKIRWGILSTGNIAGQFVEGLRFLRDAEIAAVGSRTQEAADRFGARYGIPRRHDSYARLAADPEIDVVYIGTPHTLHAENTILCLEAGKAVLCEKPFALNAVQAKRMIETAQRKKLFLMEAMWTRFLPAVIEMRRRLSEGAIGEPRMMEASFGFPAPFDPSGRLFDPALGGGALLDVGIYPLSMAYFVFGPPARIASLADLGKTGVDERAGIVMDYSGGRIAVLHFSITTDLPNDMTVSGSKGRIRIHAPIFRPAALTITKRMTNGGTAGRAAALVRRIARRRWLAPVTKSLSGGSDRTISIPFKGNGYNYEAAEVMRAIREGQTESPRMPLDESLAIMRTMDAIRSLWGLSYPDEIIARRP